MTKLEQARIYIQTLQIAEFFEFIEDNAKADERVAHLRNTFIYGVKDASFYDQLRTLADVILNENPNPQQPKAEEKSATTRVINTQNYFEKVDNSGTINFDQRKTD